MFSRVSTNYVAVNILQIPKMFANLAGQNKRKPKKLKILKNEPNAEAQWPLIDLKDDK